MRYETAAELAKRFNVTTRTVQLWAKNGKLKGAIKQGRDWLIPEDAVFTDKSTINAQELALLPAPMLTCSYTPGTALSLVENIENESIKTIAMAEYYHCIGEYQKASDMTELFFNSEDIVLKLSACYIYVFANLNLGRTNLVKMGYGCILEGLNQELPEGIPPEPRAMCLFFATSISTLLTLPKPKEDLWDYVKYLPMGLKLMTYYNRAFDEYKKENYQKALGILETALSISCESYPIPLTFIHLGIALVSIALKNTEQAKEHYLIAWSLASADKFYTIFAEHGVLLCGLGEAAASILGEEEYQKLLDITNQFNKCWMKLDRSNGTDGLTEKLTTKEFAVAMLASRGWSNEEIADYMRLSVNTVKKYLNTVFQKLGVSHRNDLKKCINR